MKCVSKAVRITTAFFVLFTLASCATRLPGSFEIPDPGHLLVSLETSRQNSVRSMELDIARVHTDPTGWLKQTRAVVKFCRSRSVLHCDLPDYRDADDDVGLVIARRLPPGQYVVRAIRIKSNESRGDFGFLNLGPSKDLDIHFTINPGTTSYLGRFSLLTLTTKDLDNTQARGNAEVQVSNQLPDDIKKASDKMPHLFANVRNFLPNTDQQKLMRQLNKHYAVYSQNVYEIRSERTTDGKEKGTCDWWC